MTTLYLDLYRGSDSNSGLLPSAPKRTVVSLATVIAGLSEPAMVKVAGGAVVETKVSYTASGTVFFEDADAMPRMIDACTSNAGWVMSNGAINSFSDGIAVNVAPSGAGKLGYKAVTVPIDGYSELFADRLYLEGQLNGAGVVLKYCSDTTGDVPVYTQDIGDATLFAPLEIPATNGVTIRSLSLWAAQAGTSYFKIGAIYAGNGRTMCRGCYVSLDGEFTGVLLARPTGSNAFSSGSPAGLTNIPAGLYAARVVRPTPLKYGTNLGADIKALEIEGGYDATFGTKIGMTSLFHGLSSYLPAAQTLPTACVEGYDLALKDVICSAYNDRSVALYNSAILSADLKCVIQKSPSTVFGGTAYVGKGEVPFNFNANTNKAADYLPAKPPSLLTKNVAGSNAFLPTLANRRPIPFLIRQGKDYLITVRLDYVRGVTPHGAFACLLHRHANLITGTTLQFFSTMSKDGDYYATLLFTGVREHTNFVILSINDEATMRVTRMDEL